jgi:saccharopine dehydrogenase-like NADP-dependent oxidoreductase
MPKNVLLFGAGKSATVLIDYLVLNAPIHDWTITIADANREQILAKTGPLSFVTAVQLDITNDSARLLLVQQSDIVISMMPPALHGGIARDCVACGKNLLTASYLDDGIRNLLPMVLDKHLLFICEMGLDPGIDHMSAMKIIDGIRQKGGTITSFRSHCGGLVAPESDNNPWRYKISWNPRNIVNAGKAGAEFKIDGRVQHRAYKDLFKHCREVQVQGLDPLVAYPNRDSLAYLPLYNLESAVTFERTTLRYPSFCVGWDAIVQANLTDDQLPLRTNELSFAKWSAGVIPFVNSLNEPLLQYLGVFDEQPVPPSAKTSADILQYLLETKLAMRPAEKDMIVMLHEISYELDGRSHTIESSLVVKGEDHLRTAMAKTVGLPLGIAAKLMLAGQIELTGIHIPTLQDIYEPVLAELEMAGITFTERELENQ